MLRDATRRRRSAHSHMVKGHSDQPLCQMCSISASSSPRAKQTAGGTRARRGHKRSNCSDDVAHDEGRLYGDNRGAGAALRVHCN
jgi:hypothetical protein